MKHALQTGWGRNLGMGSLATLEWKGKRGMLWSDLLQEALPKIRVTPPDIFMVHLAGNDLILRKGKSLILQVIPDFQTLRDMFPSMRLLWSNIIPRLVWQADFKPGWIDRLRRGVNEIIGRAMRLGLGSVIPHPKLQGHWLELFRSDGVLLSELVMDIFLKDPQGGIRAKIFGLDGGLGAYK